jgi:hydroxymethylglutaryl-CoA lyase
VPEIFDQTVRDGLSAYPPLPTTTKLALIDRMRLAGLTYFEVARFPRHDRFPQFADNEAMLKGVADCRGSATVAAFALDLAGAGEALAYAQYFDELHTPVFVSPAYASYIHDEIWEQSLRRIATTLQLCEERGVRLTVGIGTSFGCPLDATSRGQDTAHRAADIARLGVRAIMLGDTAGQASPPVVERVVQEVREQAPEAFLRVHFHNTFGRALTNTWTALRLGVDGVDTSLLGLGGDRYRYFRDKERVDNGNCATEELVALMSDSGLPCEVDTRSVNDTARWLFEQVEGLVHGRSAFAELVPLERDESIEVQQGTGRH